MNAVVSRFGAQFSTATRVRQVLLLLGLVVIVGAACLTAWLVLRPTYEVLFRDLKRQDAAAITAELEKEKIPFQFDETSSAILVPKGDTRAIRLKLMSRDLKLSGVVGLELFNNSDLGLTDFAQKVNYQRALQGELARTIMALDEIELARVHLTLPEASIFRRDGTKPKASVAVFVRNGEKLTAETIRGIQRLVAASVPELSVADVSVLDGRGAPASAAGAEADDPALQLKHAIEHGYEQKVGALIAGVIGPNQASVSVEAMINADQMRSMREITETRSDPDSGARDVRVPLPSSRPDAGPPPLPTNYGAVSSSQTARTMRDVEQVIKTPGAVRRLSVGIVFNHPLDPDVLARLTGVISASIGLDQSRGDVLSTVSRATQNAGGTTSPEHEALPQDTSGSASEPTSPELAATGAEKGHDSLLNVLAGRHVALTLAVTGGVVALLALLLWRSFRRTHPAHTRRLTAAQRDEHVARLRALLSNEGGRHD